MSRKLLLCALLGLLLVARPAWAEEEEEEQEDGVDEKDVVVITDKSIKGLLKKHKFALVGGVGSGHAAPPAPAQLTSRAPGGRQALTVPPLPPCRLSSTPPVSAGRGQRPRRGPAAACRSQRLRLPRPPPPPLCR